MLNRDIVIDPAFEGPPSSAHGGYTCGLLSRYLPTAGAAFPGHTSSSFSRCVVRGTDRTDADAFRIFPGRDPPGGRLASERQRPGRRFGQAGVSDRELHAGSALYSPSGALQAFSHQTWITLTEVPK